MAKSKLALAHISVSFGTKPLLTDISISLESGQITALVGRSGSGKTLCALALQGLLPSNLTQTSGSILLDDTPLATAHKASATPIIASILQNPRTCFDPLHTMQSHIAESVRAWGKAYDPKRIASLLDTLGLDSSVLDRYAFAMSGGELQRVMIAIALLADAQFLIADEPTSDLDAIATQEIMQILQRICKERGIGILLITHDTRLMRIADRSYHIDAGKIIDDIRGFYNPFTHTPIYDRQKLESTLTLLRLQHISKVYPITTASATIALDSISLEIYAGQRLGIVGRSGSGKSTLAKLIARLERESSGQITYPAHWQTHKSLKSRRHFYSHIQLLFQDPISALNPNQTIWQSLTQGLHHLRGITDKAAQEQKIFPILSALDLDRALLHTYPAMLSGGQAARINLARALVVEPQLLILDESTSSLDSHTEAMILDFIATMHANNLTDKQYLSVLCITHDLALARAFCDRIVLMDSGKIIEIVAHNEPFTSPQGKLLESTFTTAAASADSRAT